MYYAKRSKRVTKETKGQVKFRFSSLDKYSQEMVMLDLHTRLSQVNHLTNHLYKKLYTNQLVMPKDQLQAILLDNQYKVIEANVTNGHLRYLLRGTQSFTCCLSGYVQKVNLCIVVETSSKYIITAYLNACNDNHQSLNASRYIN